MNKYLLGLIVLLLLAFGAYFLFRNKAVAPAPSPMPTSAPMPTSSQQPASQSTVTLTANGFEPATLTIKAGQTVNWINNSGESATVNSNPHPVHTDYPPLNLGSFANGASLQLTFPTAGTYGYHNHLNPSEGGTIIVQ